MEKRQRLRVTFSKGEEIKYTSHLDLFRLWERVLRRAGVPLAYSQGFNPRPKLNLGAPLPVGFTGRNELMDIWLTRYISPLYFAKRVKSWLPPGLDVVSVEEVYIKLPALQTQVRYAEYRATLLSDGGPPEMQARLDRLLKADSLPCRRKRRGREREYDLRPLVEALWIEASPPHSPTDSEPAGEYTLGMRLQADSQATGRPDEVLKALGLGDRPRSIERIRLEFER
jgi:radical SAM-linked protein